MTETDPRVDFVGESETENIYHTKDGRVIDINNYPGVLRAKDILEGKIDIDRFISPPNMPGKKLAELRARHRANIKQGLSKVKDIVDNKYNVGDFVEYKNESLEVLAVDDKKGVRIKTYNKKKKKITPTWIHHTKVKPMTVDTHEEE